VAATVTIIISSSHQTRRSDDNIASTSSLNAFDQISRPFVSRLILMLPNEHEETQVGRNVLRTQGGKQYFEAATTVQPTQVTEW
jgi:hypothetical protein